MAGRVVSDLRLQPPPAPDFSLGCTWEPPATPELLLHRGGQDIEVGTRTPSSITRPFEALFSKGARASGRWVGAQQSLV